MRVLPYLLVLIAGLNILIGAPLLLWNYASLKTFAPYAYAVLEDNPDALVCGWKM